MDMSDRPLDDAPLTPREAQEIARFVRGLGLAFADHDIGQRMLAFAQEIADPSLHTWDRNTPSAPRDADGLLVNDPDADGFDQ